MKCPHCDANVYETDSVCMSCGKELRQSAPPSPTARPEPKPAASSRPQRDAGWVVKLVVWAVIVTPIVAIVYFSFAGLTDLMTHGDWRLEDKTMIRFSRTSSGAYRLVRYWDFGTAVETEYDGTHKGAIPTTRMVLTESPYMVKGEKATLWPGFEEAASNDPKERELALTRREKAERTYETDSDRPAYCYIEFEDVECRFVFPNRLKLRTTKPGKLRWLIHGIASGTTNTWESASKALKRKPAHYIGKSEGEESYTVSWGNGQLHFRGSKEGAATWKNPD